MCGALRLPRHVMQGSNKFGIQKLKKQIKSVPLLCRGVVLFSCQVSADQAIPSLPPTADTSSSKGCRPIVRSGIRSKNRIHGRLLLAVPEETPRSRTKGEAGVFRGPTSHRTRIRVVFQTFAIKRIRSCGVRARFTMTVSYRLLRVCANC